MNDVKIHDFEKSKKYNPSQIRFLTSYIEGFVKSSNLQLQYELKNKSSLKVALKEVYQQQYNDFIEHVDYDSVIVDFSIEDKAEALIYSMDKKVALIIVDCLLGSNGQVKLDRAITEIDEEILNYIVSSLFKKTSDFTNVSTAHVNEIYTNKAQYNNANTKGAIFVAILDFYLNNEIVGNIKIGTPFESVENILDKAMAERLENSSLSSGEKNINEDMLEAMFEKQITLDLVAELGSTELTVRELLSLETGDAFILNRKIDEDIDVIVGGERAYIAKPGRIASNNAIIIVDSIEGDMVKNERENE